MKKKEPSNVQVMQTNDFGFDTRHTSIVLFLTLCICLCSLFLSLYLSSASSVDILQFAANGGQKKAPISTSQIPINNKIEAEEWTPEAPLFGLPIVHTCVCNSRTVKLTNMHVQKNKNKFQTNPSKQRRDCCYLPLKIFCVVT